MGVMPNNPGAEEHIRFFAESERRAASADQERYAAFH